MQAAELPEWEPLLIEEAIVAAQRRFVDEQHKAKRRDVELRRQQAYHRLAVAIDRPARPTGAAPGQLSFFPSDATLFD